MKKPEKKTEPIPQLSISLACKLGSGIVHAKEMLGPGASEFDRIALRQIIDDPEVVAWVKAMQKLALVALER